MSLRHLRQMRHQANQGPSVHRSVADVTDVAAPASSTTALHERTAEPISPTSHYDTDAQIYCDFLRCTGPLTYGAAAIQLRWGVTRAWLAQNELTKEGLIRFDNLGRAIVADSHEDASPLSADCEEAER